VVTMMKSPITIQNEAGQTMVEYAVVLGVITFVIVTTLSLRSGHINAAFTRTLSILTSVV
jgi:Flp pilus assembly pilin Flp